MIPFIKTNVPQIGMTFETTNNIWGRTLNPWNKGRSVGGSSGGEGAAISSGCSLIGIGSDIGGSIRIPADQCGIFGIKPYSKRISNKYHAIISKYFASFSTIIPLCIGPMAKSSRDLALFMDIATN
jgi:fatty acid amide hydrolase